MKIAFFSDTYRPHKNGVATALSFQKKSLEEENHQVFLFIPYIPNIPSEKNIYTLPSITFPFQKEHRIASPYSLKYDLHLKREKPHIIHTHTPFSLGIFGLYESKKLKIPIVHTYHTLLTEYAYYIWDHFPNIVKHSLINEHKAKEIAIWISRTYCNYCDLIIAPSTKIKKLLIDFEVKKPIEVLPNGIDLEKFKPIPKNLARERLNLPKEATLLLFVGRLGKEKNIEYLIDVISYLKYNSRNQIYLIIVGDNPDKRVLEGLKKKAKDVNVEDRTIFTGYLEYEKVINMYYASDIFVFSSLTETQGLVVLEALSAGLPVIALEDEAISDFIKDGFNGFLIPWKENLKESVNIFSEKVNLLIENKNLYNSLSQNALETSQNFHIKKINQNLLSLYKTLLKEYNIIDA